MTVVVGTAGHIDHGKTTLLRALTGIDADRLPEERRRGMTIDIGYAHLELPDGSQLDFVDVPGHDRLVGNMLVGAGEVDAALLVVAADDGPRAQTDEHLALLDALGLGHGIVALTKVDLVDEARLAEVEAALAERLASTSLAGSPIIQVSAVAGDGLERLRDAFVWLRDTVLAERGDAAGRAAGEAPRLAVDRVFTVRGRGLVVTGTLRGGPLERGLSLRVAPGPGSARVRELQVHGRAVERVAGGGRVALNVAADGELTRGAVLTSDARVVAADRLLVALRAPVPDRRRYRLHLGTAAVDAEVGRSGRDALDLPDGRAAAVLRLRAPVAAAPGDRFVLRRPGDDKVVGGLVLDARPVRGVSRRRQTADRVAALEAAVRAGDPARIDAATLVLHGALARAGSAPLLDGDVRAAAEEAALASSAAHHAAHPAETGAPLVAVRTAVAMAVRRLVAVRGADATAAAVEVVDRLVRDGRLVRESDRVRLPAHRAVADPGLDAAMDRLEAALAVLAPPPLGEAARASRCPPAGVRALERAGRIVVLAPDLAYAAATYRELAATALRLAAARPLAPAAFRDATGTSRKYVMPILEDLDRRGLLRRTPAGHVPGPRAPARSPGTP